MSAGELPFCEPTALGVRLFVRVSPRASQDRIEGVERDAAGRSRLRVRVTAPPDKGLANQRVAELIAGAMRIAASRIAVRHGEAARSKTLEVAGDTKDLMALSRALAGEGR